MRDSNFTNCVKPLVLLISFFGVSIAGAAADYHYQGTLKIEPATGYMDASWLITVNNPGTAKRTFYVRDTLNKPTISGSAVTESEIEKVAGFDDFWAMHVTLERPPTGKPQQFQISYSGVLLPEPLPNKINSITPDVVELNVDSFWFPMDASFSKLLSADLTIDIDGDWQGISTGQVTTTSGQIRVHNADPRLDIAFTLARNPKVISTDNFTIFDLRPEAIGIEALTQQANACTRELNALFGNQNKLPTGKLVVTERNESGYARENYIVLTDIGKSSPTALTLFLCHEFAHFWASGADFTGVENWLNEALAEYSALLAVRTIFGEEAYDEFLQKFEKQIAGETLPPIWQDGITARGPYLVLYRKGPLAIAAFEKRYGREQTAQIIRQFFNQQDKTTPTLLEIVGDVSGEEAAAYFRELLAK